MNTMNQLAQILVALMLFVGLTVLGATLIMTIYNILAPQWLALNFMQCALLSGTAILVSCWVRLKSEAAQKKGRN